MGKLSGCSHLVLRHSPGDTRMESRGINPLETKLGEGKLNTGKEGAPQNRGEGEELVLSSWEVSHAPYAPLPPPRVTDRLFAVSRGRHWKPVPIPWGNRGPKETRDCLRSPSSPASGPRELPQHSCNSPHHLCMPSTVPGQRGTQPRAGLDGTEQGTAWRFCRAKQLPSNTAVPLLDICPEKTRIHALPPSPLAHISQRSSVLLSLPASPGSLVSRLSLFL